MSLRETDVEVTTNIALLRRLGFFVLFNPNSRKIFDCNVYRALCVLVTVVIECLTAYGVIGLFSVTDGPLDNINLSNLLVFYQINVLCLVEMFTFMYKADDIWRLYDVTRVDFLTGGRGRRHARVLYEYRDTSVRITNYLYVFLVSSVFTWILYPQLLNIITFVGGTQRGHGAANKRFYNVFDIRYPVTTQTYNDYYYLFYLMEVSVILAMGYTLIMFNTLFISFSFVLMAQYEIVAKSFEVIGHGQTHAADDRRETPAIGNENSRIDDEACIADFKSIVSDHVRLYRMLKLYYSILWNILIPSVVITSSGVIVLTYSLVLIFTSSGSTTIVDILKFNLAVFYVLVDLFILCYLVDMINTNKESVKFRMYSCNWTSLNVKFRKLLLLSMQMYDNHKSTVKITPKIIVNMQFYANVMIRSFNVLSVLMKSYSRDKYQT